jgi:hypothetical protein
LIKEEVDGLKTTPFNLVGEIKIPDVFPMRMGPCNLRSVKVSVHETMVSPNSKMLATQDLRQHLQQGWDHNTAHYCFEAETNKLSDEPILINVTGHVKVKKTPIDYEQHQPYFLHVPIEKTRHTFENATQWVTVAPSGHLLPKTRHSLFPAHNVHQGREPIAMDTINAGAPSIGGGHHMAQMLVGRASLVIDVIRMMTQSHFTHTFQDVIHK